MLAAYYECEHDSKELFSKFKISASENFEKHLNQYDTIFLNMQEFLSQTKNIEEMIELIKKSVIWDLLDMRMQQHTADDYFYDYDGNKFYPGDGLMPGQAPCYIPNAIPVPGMGSFYDIIPWGSTCILGTYWHYIFYGDKKIIEDNYDAGMRYFKYLQTKVTEEGFINHGLGDWGNPRNELVRENIETAFFYADAKVLATFAKILGKEADKEHLFDRTIYGIIESVEKIIIGERADLHEKK